jgi:hypothetical protein
MLAGGIGVAAETSRAALFLMESDALALELQEILQSGDAEWTVMLTRAIDAAAAALFAGPLDLAVLVPAATETLDDLIAGLQVAGTPTILVSGPDNRVRDVPSPGSLMHLTCPLDPETLKAALRPFALGSGPLSPPHATCA